MNQEKQRPPLDVVLTDALREEIKANQGPQLHECKIGCKFMVRIATSTGYSQEELQRRLRYFIDEGVLVRRASHEAEIMILRFADLDAEARKRGVQHYFNSSMPK